MIRSILKKKIFLATGLILLVFLGLGCSLDSDSPLAVGDSHQGGIVAYLFEDGDEGFVEGEVHGLIAASDDQASVPWAISPYDTQYVPSSSVLSSSKGQVTTTGKAIGTGYENTLLIIEQHTTITDQTSYAAGLAHSYTGGSYTDWFLPSQDELYKLYINKDLIGGFLTGDNDRYYCSSEKDHDTAYWQLFDVNGNFEQDLKTYSNRVRPVREF